MSESTAKAQLDQEGGEGATGYITPSDIQDAIGIIYDDFEAGDALRLSLGGGTLSGSLAGTSLSLSSTLAVTGNTTLTGTLNSKVVNDLVTGPASATDNALVRFDSTTGKVVQNSGITVDDSGQVTSDLTVSKATPTLRVASTGTTGAEIAVATTGVGFRVFTAQTGALPRWKVGANDTPEAGTDAGSDFLLWRYNDAGSRITPNPLTILRKTGKWTFGSVGADAGLELGSSGPRVMSGTGSPEGVVTAPVGSIWFQSDSTVGVTHWRKATGSGNTGWVVMSGDTGQRNLSAEAMLNGWGNNGVFRLRRIGNTVTVYLQAVKASATADVAYTLPSGFRPAISAFVVACVTSTADDYTQAYIVGTGDMAVVRSTTTGNTTYFAATYLTADAWPTSLPGSAA